MTTTLPAPTVEVERASRTDIAAQVLKATIEAGLPYPKQIDFSSELWIDVEGVDELRLWMAHLGASYEDRMPRRHPELPIVMHWAEVPRFHGWHLTIKTNDPVTDEPCCSYILAADGGQTHQKGCTLGRDHASEVRREMAEALTYAASTLETYRPEAVGAALADGTIVVVGVTDADRTLYALKSDPLVAMAEGREIDLTSVGGYFRATWAKLPALRRAELVEACQVAGWMGDWDAAYRHVMGNVPRRDLRGDMSPVPGGAADDARLIVSELDDLEHVDVKQLATVVDVDPDAEIAYAVAHRHEPVPVVDVLTDDPELSDVGRGDAEIARIGQPIDLTQDGGV